MDNMRVGSMSKWMQLVRTFPPFLFPLAPFPRGQGQKQKQKTEMDKNGSALSVSYTPHHGTPRHATEKSPTDDGTA